MKVHVDEERCQGHGRCYALAPELFEPDDLGNGQAIGDGTVPAELRTKARLAAANCPERPSRSRSDDATEPPTDLTRDRRSSRTGRPTSTTPTRPGPPTRSRSGTSSARRCPVAHTERYGGAWLPTRHDDVVGHRLRHRALHVAAASS